MSWQWNRWGTVAARVLVWLPIPAFAVACSGSAGSSPKPEPSALVAVQLTGYRSVSLFGTSGAVTVALTASDSQGIVDLVKSLPGGSGPDCQEPPGLVYRVTIKDAVGLVRGTVISGYRCGASVSVAIPGQILSWHTDAGCRLDRAVRRLAPARAEGTRQASIGCS
jgi:hypothetical protein